MGIFFSTGKMLISRAAVVVLVVLVLLQILVNSVESRRVKSSYVGVDACKKCHGSTSIGSQYKIWAATPHAGASQTLSSGKALKIGQKYGINTPSKDLKCLKCHATGGGKNPDTISEGVGCEACHGPGSRYRDFDNHASFDSRENAYRKAIRLGMYPIIGDDSIKAREKLCRHCHTQKRLCMDWNTKDKSKLRELPLSLIADFIYRHPVR